jgi:membrane fusion protein (multidrug efflux system)
MIPEREPSMTDILSQPPDTRQQTRKLWLTRLGIAVGVIVVLYGLYWLFYARNFETTDDAYVGGDIVSITSRESATVLTLRADNTQEVKRGDVLIEFDPVKAQIGMQQAEANLARAVRNVRTNFSKVDEYRAQVTAARVTVSQAQSDYRRRASAGTAVSREEMSHARDGVMAAQASLRAAESSLAQAEAAVGGTRVSTNPDVLAAIAQLRDAAITLSHMQLTTPVSGVVAQRTVQVGQQIAPGTPLMAVVPLDAVWIDANFKERQLRSMRVGQPATVTADVNGETYHGVIVGIGAGTGSAFALLPPQNASGNWIKIVQRVPVRIALDPKEIKERPLRVGLSVQVSVDVGETPDEKTMKAWQRSMHGVPGDNGGPEIDQMIARILKKNGA